MPMLPEDILRWDLFQQAIIEYLQSVESVTEFLSSPEQVLEEEYRGKDWTYPCVRVMIEEWVPDSAVVCIRGSTQFRVTVYSAKASSKRAKLLLHAVVVALRSKVFKGETFRSNETSIVRVRPHIPLRDDEFPVWAGDVTCRTNVTSLRT